MLRKLIVLDYVDEKEIVRVVGRDQSIAWYACEAALGRRDMLGLMDRKHREVYVEYLSLMVSCYWIKASITAW